MNIVIAASYGDYSGLVSEVKGTTGANCIFINSPKELTAGALKNINPKYIFFPHWSHIISKDIFDQFECVIFHMTDVPYGRGGSPLQNLIVRGHKHTKISALKCVQALDAGPVYLKRDLSLAGTATEIFERARPIIKEMIVEIIQRNLTPEPQIGEPTTFTRRTPDQSEIKDFTTLDALYDHIRMLDAEGYPKAFIQSNGLRIEFSNADKVEGELSATVKITKAQKP